VDLQGNAKNIHVVAEAATGLVWDPWGEIFNERLPAPPNQYFVVKGTTLHRSYEKE
jgi:thiol-activated cytolysin